MLEHFFILILSSLYLVFNDLGISIIAMTLLIKSLLIPISIPSMKAQKKMGDIQPKLSKLKSKYKDKPKELQQAQVDLYKKYNINPFSGCLPQVVMIVILIGLYRALNTFLDNGQIDNMIISTNFLWMNLTQPDKTFILPILAGISQLAMSLMISPGAEVRDIVPNESKSKKIQQKNKEEEDVAEMAKTMQKQMVFLMPFMTMLITTRFPSGLAVYWVVANIFSITQQYFVSGPGGLVVYWQRAKLLLKNK